MKCLSIAAERMIFVLVKIENLKLKYHKKTVHLCLRVEIETKNRVDDQKNNINRYVLIMFSISVFW